jgi:hypothetical protein
MPEERRAALDLAPRANTIVVGVSRSLPGLAGRRCSERDRDSARRDQGLQHIWLGGSDDRGCLHVGAPCG